MQRYQTEDENRDVQEILITKSEVVGMQIKLNGNINVMLIINVNVIKLISVNDM